MKKRLKLLDKLRNRYIGLSGYEKTGYSPYSVDLLLDKLTDNDLNLIKALKDEDFINKIKGLLNES